ncbi:MAG: hypothetical protein ACJAZ2_001196, partial [Glaciecola sp.]
TEFSVGFGYNNRPDEISKTDVTKQLVSALISTVF